MNTGLRLTLIGVLLVSFVACGDDSLPADGGPGLDVPGVDTSRPPSVVPFRLLSWNVQNFFDARNDPEKFDDVPDGSSVASKLNSLADVIRAENPDFIALQEIENLPLLQRLVGEGLAGMGYDHVGLMEGFDPRGIDVGFISRFPITNVVSHIGESFEGPTGESQRFTRDALEVFVDANGIDVLVMVSHFISQRCDNATECAEKDARREGEAIQARDLLGRRANTREHVIFVGDINDTPDSPTYAAMTMGDTIIDLSLTVPIAERWSFIFQGQRQQIDYMFGSMGMSDDLVDVRFLRGADVERASDHSPIVADFQLRP
ncbi:MAG: endonuclease/exonuclease/phosphatase family metal-dependent hydrolase [Polyangiales bacterium]|jgi:endonuclease/exonuclease/phosphatase family metal-dependent hydrolase